MFNNLQGVNAQLVRDGSSMAQLMVWFGQYKEA
jgi:hypothetical protein